MARCSTIYDLRHMPFPRLPWLPNDVVHTTVYSTVVLEIYLINMTFSRHALCYRPPE